MTIDEHIAATEHLLACQKAFKEGRSILYQGEEMEKGDTLSWAADPYDYRITPEPEIRPWKPEEVPVGAVCRRRDQPHIRWIIKGTDDQFYEGEEWSWPHEQHDESTWKPCGVVEE